MKLNKPFSLSTVKIDFVNLHWKLVK